jgi:uncharacterized alkaline shock family protein YloU
VGRPPSAAVATAASEAARRVEGVVELDAGPLATKVTYGNGGRVAGVTVHDGGPGRTVTLYLKVAWGPIPEVAEAAMTAAADALDAVYPDDGPWRVDVEVVDITPPEVAALPVPSAADDTAEGKGA